MEIVVIERLQPAKAMKELGNCMYKLSVHYSSGGKSV
jgi:hypothetical protein